MTISGRPLLDNIMDAALFVGRRVELAALVGALGQDLNVAVIGEPGAGKTSLLHALQHQLRRSLEPGAAAAGEWELAYVRAEGARTAAEILTRVAVEVLGRRTAVTVDGGTPGAVAETIAALRKHRQDQTNAYRARTRSEAGSSAGPLRAVIIIDDVPGPAGQEFFATLRDELWATGYRWVCACRPSEAAAIEAPADAFFERVLRLDELEHGDAVAVIERRQLWPPGWAAQVADVVGGNPRRLLAAARDFVERPGELEAALGARGRRDAAIAALGRPALMLAAELDALGSASASDDALLARLGWTRARATQVLTQLERAGLATSSAQKLAHGRPKKVFRLVGASDLVGAFPPGRSDAHEQTGPPG